MTISKQVAGVNAAEPGLYPDQYNCDYSLAVDYTVSRNSAGKMVVTINTVRLYSYLQWYLQNVIGTSAYFESARIRLGVGTPPYNTPNLGQSTYTPGTNYDCYSASGVKVVDNTTPANSSPGWAYFTFKGTKPAWVINSDYDVTDTSKTQSLMFYIEIRDGEVGYLYKVNIPFTITLEPNRWTVSYNANGGSGAPASQAKVYGSNLTLSSTIPTRTNYVFNDWTTKSDGTGTHYQKGGTYSTNATATLYAQWFPPNYITFYANGGTGVPSQITKTHGVDVTIPNTIPTRTNYVFIDWTTNEDGTGTHYQRGATYSANADANLYAQWHAPHNVSYDANGGTNAPAAQVKVYGQNLTLTTAKPTRAGWNFKNWNTAQSGSGGTAYNPGATYTYEADLKLYAQWERWITGVSITDLTAKRVADGSSTSESDEGTYAYVTASFNVKGAAAASMTVSMTCTKDGTSVTVPVTLSQSTFTKAAANDDASAPYTLTARASGLVTDSKYTFAMTVATTNTSATQTIASQTRSAVLPTAYYTIDVLHGGHGIAFGKAATTAELMDVGYDLNVDGNADINGNLNVDGNADINGDRLTTTGGRVTGYPTYGSGHLRLFANGIAFKDPYNNSSSSGNSDFGWIRMIEETANSGYLEIATGDDGNEPIYVRQYNTSNAINHELTLLDTSGNSVIPGLMTFLNTDNVAINFRNNTGYSTTVSHQTSGNEALVFASKQGVTSFIFVNGEDSVTNHANTRWQSLTPGLQIKNNCVSIGSLIPNDTAPTYKLAVNGTLNATGIITQDGKRLLSDLRETSDISNIDTFADSYLYPHGNSGGGPSGTKPTGTDNGFGILNLHTHTGNYYSQLGFDSSFNKLWHRASQGSSSWSAWKQVEFTDYVKPVSAGGTGATTASGALSNLGAASSSHTHNYAGSDSAGGVAYRAYRLRFYDTRSDNQNPNWYFTNYGYQLVPEFKSSSAIGAPSNANYVHCLTLTSWGDQSGGYPAQIAIGNDCRLAWRVGNSGTAWGSWRTNFGVNLYANSSGSNGKISLATSAANYRAIRIYFKTNEGYVSSVDVEAPNGKYVALGALRGDSASTPYKAWMKSRVVIVSGAEIYTGGTAYSEYGGNSSGTWGINPYNYIYILRVDAFD